MSGRPAAFAVALLAAFAAGRSAAASPSDELVQQARAHEAAHEEDLAARRYTEALTLDPENEDAWLGLGNLRMKLGEAAEADRVYTAALERSGSMRRVLERRARARWVMGRRGDAEADLERYAREAHDAAAYRELAGWYGAEGRSPAQLAVWRLLLAQARDPREIDEARRMVRALVLLVDGADPAASPADPSTTRRELARMARRPP